MKCSLRKKQHLSVCHFWLGGKHMQNFQLQQAHWPEFLVFSVKSALGDRVGSFQKASFLLIIGAVFCGSSFKP